MKILFVCQQYIHAARWINQLKNSEHEIYVFDCLDKPIHEDLLWTNYITNWSKRKRPVLKGEYFLKKKIPTLYQKIAPYLQVTASEKLIEIIADIQPDLVHSLEMQSETYPLLKVRKKIAFKWAYFSWGSDLYLYQNKNQHRKKIKEVLAELNYFFSDNQRDVDLAKALGFHQLVSGIFPGGGGYPLKEFKPLVAPISKRNLLLIKGYQHWAGRALVVLEAVELIIDQVRDLEIYVYSAHPIVIEKIVAINKKHGIQIGYSSRYNQISQLELLKKFGQARIAIGNNISDGIPNTLLEAMILGAFPIQSNPGAVSEYYLKHGENGLLINNPDDASEVASLIKQALNSTELLERAYLQNSKLAKNLEFEQVQKLVLEAYKKIETE